MKRIYKFITADGVIHATEGDAWSHAEKRYMGQLSYMAEQIVKLGTYVDVQKYIDEHLDVFETLKRIKDDMRLDPLVCECE